MIDQQMQTSEPKFTATDDAYLAELTIRLTKMRELHARMERGNGSTGWLKRLIDKH